MSYVPSHQAGFKLAQPQALTFIEHTASTTQTISVGNKVNIGTIYTKFGSFSPTISSDVLTLPSGYFYYIESAVQGFKVAFVANCQVSTQHYDETNNQSIGTQATVFQVSQADQSLFSRDACARALLDCTSGSRDISLKITSVTNFDAVNYNAAGYVYAGLGRTVIWQLQA